MSVFLGMDTKFLAVGEHPFLDFLNTVPVVHGKSVEYLASPADLAAWLAWSGTGDGKPVSVGDWADALEFREAARSVLASNLQGGPDEAALTAFNRAVARLGPPMLAVSGEGLEVSSQADPWAKLFRGVIQAGMDLLASPRLSRVRMCANPDCVLFFLDTSKPGTRRWCSMATCGNLMKARGHRARARAE